MGNERRKYPRVSAGGDVNIFIAGVSRNGSLLNVSPVGIQIQCRHQLIEQLAEYHSNSGIYPDFELEFDLPEPGKLDGNIRSTCNVSYCRRLSKDSYHLGLTFVQLSETDERRVADYISLKSGNPMLH